MTNRFPKYTYTNKHNGPSFYEEKGLIQKIYNNSLVQSVTQYINKNNICNAKKEITVLDIGCGTGFTLDSLLYNQKTSNYPFLNTDINFIGIDKSEFMLNFIREKFNQINSNTRKYLLNGDFLSIDASDLKAIKPLMQKSNIIISNFTLHWLSNPIEWLKYVINNMPTNCILGISIPVHGSFEEIKDILVNNKSLSLIKMPQDSAIRNFLQGQKKEEDNFKIAYISTEKKSQTFSSSLDAIRSLKVFERHKSYKNNYTVSQMRNFLNIFNSSCGKSRMQLTYNVFTFILHKIY